MTTNRKFNTAEAVRFIKDTTRRLQTENIELSPALDRAIAERFPEMTIEQFGHVLKVHRADIEAEHAEFEAAHKRETARNDMAMQIYAGLENVAENFEEACRIKAQGKGPVAEAARRWLIAMNDVTARLENAAHEAHPDFVQAPDKVWHYTGTGKMPSVEAMVEWFQINHPAQARAIGAEP